MNTSLIPYIDQIVAQRPFCKDILTSYKKLISILEPINVTLPEITLDENLKKIKLEEGFSLFSRDELPFDPNAATKALWQFLEYTSEEPEQGLSTDIFKAVLAQDHDMLGKISAGLNIEPERLYFLAKTALKPSLNALKEYFSHELEKVGWDNGYCPLCGSEPNMAYLDKKGRRHLHCELCSLEWNYPRINCPFCKNQDHETLGYFYSENEEGFRVDFCKKCGRYIKTIDRRVFEQETPMELEHLATLHLDILAEQQGFK